MNNEFLEPNSNPNCLIDSKKGNDSISPTVPPTSTNAISDFFAPIIISFLISSVTCGTTCTVLPK